MPARIDSAICAKCKGVRKLCGLLGCPILLKLQENLNLESIIKRHVIYAPSPPSILVGEKGYPLVRLGPNIVPIKAENIKEFDDPTVWWGNKSINDIIKIRSSLVYSSFVLNAKDARHHDSRLLEKTREIALSSRPILAEYYYRKMPKPVLTFDGILAPTGPRGEIKDILLGENPIVPRKVDKLIYDTDAKAVDAIRELYFSNISYYDIVRLLEVGLLGEKKERKVVPTRWAITAVDQTLGNILLEEVKKYNEIDNYLIYHVSYIGNNYTLLLIPGHWSFEMLEIWLPRSIWVKSDKPYIVENYELHSGKSRKSGVDGGYHAIRYPVLEHLHRIKRQAIVIVIREITREYYAPLGSWQIRESIRNALKRKPMVYRSLREMLDTLSNFIIVNKDLILRHSVLLKAVLRQKRIIDYY